MRSNEKSPQYVQKIVTKRRQNLYKTVNKNKNQTKSPKQINKWAMLG